MPLLLPQFTNRLGENGPKPDVFTLVRVQPGLQRFVFPEPRIPLFGEVLHARDHRRDAVGKQLSGRFAHVSIRRSRTPGTASSASKSCARYASASTSLSVRSSGWRITRSVIATDPEGSGGPEYRSIHVIE